MPQWKVKLCALAVTLFAVRRQSLHRCGKNEVVGRGRDAGAARARCERLRCCASANPFSTPVISRAGLQLKMPESQRGDWLSRARQAVTEAGERVNEVRSCGRSVSDYLSDPAGPQPDILKMGERLGLPASQPAKSGS